jgi:metallo-beta-lactamase class B
MRLLIGLLLTGLFPSFVRAQVPPMVVTPLAKGVHVHTTYGMYRGQAVPSNGLIIQTSAGVVLVDTGWDSEGHTDNTEALLRWVAEHLRQPVRLCIVTHAHDDRVGGIRALRRAGVRVVSTPETARKAVAAGYESPEAVLPNDTTFRLGGVPIRCYFPGEGHTSDNIVVYLPEQRILHGGCFVKSVAAFGMGNVADANLREWSTSIRRVMQEFGIARLIVPGHEEWSDPRSLQHTLNLLEKHAAAGK